MSTKSDIEEIYHQEKYPFEKKERMASKISDMRDIDTLRKIRDIIYSENVNASATKSGNGYLMYFQNYSDETYRKIEKLLHNVQKEKLERQTRSVVELSSEDPNTNYNVSRTRLRYSNREKRLIKRQQYENIINANVLKIENRDTIVDTIRDTIRDTCQDTCQDTRQDTWQDTYQDTRQDTCRDTHQDIRQDTQQNTHIDSVQNTDKTTNTSSKGKLTTNAKKTDIKKSNIKKTNVVENNTKTMDLSDSVHKLVELSEQPKILNTSQSNDTLLKTTESTDVSSKITVLPKVTSSKVASSKATKKSSARSNDKSDQENKSSTIFSKVKLKK